MTTKPVTAFCLCLAVVSQWMTTAGVERINRMVCCCSSFVLFVSIASVAESIDAQSWFIAEPDHLATYSTAPGEPSLATVLAIVAWAISAEFQFLARHAATLSIGLGVTCLVGHATQCDVAIFYFPKISSAMALPTATCVLLMGIGFRCNPCD